MRNDAPTKHPTGARSSGRSPIFTPEVINDIHMKAELGRYRMRGFSMFKKLPGWDDLIFLPGTLTRFVIEGYREKCDTKTVLGARFAKKPLELDIPVYITGMSFGALSLEAKMALAKGASMAGTATCSGEGGMIPPERDLSTKWYYQVIQSRYGFNPHHLMLADGVEFFIGQGCKVGLGGHLMGQKVTEQVAEMRSLPAGIDQRSPARHPDWLGPDDLSLKVQETREATNYEVPIQLKLGRRARLRRRPHGGQVRPGHHLPRRRRGRHRRRPAHRRRGDRDPAAGGDPGGAPGARGRRARRRGRPRGRRRDPQRRRHRQVPGARRRRDRDRPLGADGAQLQQGDPRASPTTRARSGVPAGQCYHCHTGRCPVGITTQDPELRKRLHVDEAAQRVFNFLHTLTLEVQMLARACGKTSVHSLEPEDLAALTVEASAMAKVPLAGTDYIPGRHRGAGAGRDPHACSTSTSRTRSTTCPTPARRRGERRSRASEPAPTSVREPEKVVSIDAEYLSGERFPYQEDISLVEDIDLEAATPGKDLNWLEDVELLDGGGHARGLRPLLELVPADLLPDPRGPRERDRPQGADRPPDVGQLLRDPAQARPTPSSPSPSSARGSRARTMVGDDWQPSVLEGWEPPEH